MNSKEESTMQVHSFTRQDLTRAKGEGKTYLDVIADSCRKQGDAEGATLYSCLSTIRNTCGLDAVMDTGMFNDTVQAYLRYALKDTDSATASRISNRLSYAFDNFTAKEIRGLMK